MESRGLMGGFYRISEWIMRFSAINLLWLICSIPFLFFFGAIFLTQEAEITGPMIYSWLIMLGIVAPFTIIPATGAMFTVARKWVIGDPDVPLWRTYWRGYKENYKQSMFGGIIYILIAVVLYVNYYFYSGQEGFLQSFSLLFIVLLVALLAAFLNYLSIMVHLHMKLSQLIKNSLLITIGQPVNTIMMLVMNAAIVYISFKYSFLVVFFMGSVMAFATFWNFNRGFTHLQQKFTKKDEEEDSLDSGTDQPSQKAISEPSNLEEETEEKGWKYPGNDEFGSSRFGKPADKPQEKSKGKWFGKR